MSTSSIPPGARIAAFDIGTNSVLLTVAGRGPGGRLAPVHDSVRVCRLGQGMANAAGSLHEEAVERTLSCLRELCIEARALPARCAYDHQAKLRMRRPNVLHRSEQRLEVLAPLECRDG